MGLPSGTYQNASASYLDAGGERGNMKVWGKVITTGNAVAQAAAWADLLAKIDALSLGARVRDTYDNESTYSVARPNNGAAREYCLKGLFFDSNNGQKWVQTVVPCVDQTKLTFIPNAGAKDVVDLTTTEVANLITSLDAFPVVNPYNQTSGVVTCIDILAVRGQK